VTARHYAEISLRHNTIDNPDTKYQHWLQPVAFIG